VGPVLAIVQNANVGDAQAGGDGVAGLVQPLDGQATGHAHVDQLAWKRCLNALDLQSGHARVGGGAYDLAPQLGGEHALAEVADEAVVVTHVEGDSRHRRRPDGRDGPDRALRAHRVDHQRGEEDGDLDPVIPHPARRAGDVLGKPDEPVAFFTCASHTDDHNDDPNDRSDASNNRDLQRLRRRQRRRLTDRYLRSRRRCSWSDILVA
jgi:hypothetical protein